MNIAERKETIEFIQTAVKGLQAQVDEGMESWNDKVKTLTDRLVAIEQKSGAADIPHDQGNGVGLMQHVLKSEQYKALLGGSTTRARIELPSGMLENAVKTAIVSNGQVLSQAARLPGVIVNPLRRQRIRELCPVGTTGSNLVEFTKENVFTNNAAPQYSSPNRENVQKAESGITFTLASEQVITLAHFIPVSKQVLADAAYMQSFVNNRLLAGLALEEDRQLLEGAGTGGDLNGILKAGNYVAAPAAVTGDNELDVVLRALASIAADEMDANAILMHPLTWARLQMLKTTGDGEYLLSKPGDATAPTLWGKRVVPTTSLDEDDFLVGDFQMGCQVWDREQAAVQVSFEHSDNFTKNMATILAEQRLAFTVYRNKAFRFGSFS
jgi:HK97 family phage major capsid protein